MKQLVGVIFGLMLGSSAYAADAMMPADATPFSWAGMYFGAQAGGGSSHFTRSSTTTGAVTSDWSGSGGLVGAFIGWQGQWGNVVAGVEGDFAITGISGNDGGQGGVLDNENVDWEGAVRGRLGLAHGQWLFYGAGGWASAGMTITQTSGASSTSTPTFSGWTAGAGIDYAFSSNMIAGIEYRYTEFGSIIVPPTGFSVAGAYKSTVQEIRGRVGMKF